MYSFDQCSSNTKKWLLSGTAILILSMTISLLAGCSRKKQEQQQPATAVSEQAAETQAQTQVQETEPADPYTYTYTGELTNASAYRLVVKSDKEEKTFVTSAGTVYSFSEEGILTIGDTLEVSYHKEKDQECADLIVVKAHVDIPHTFEGMVTFINDECIIAVANQTTLLFVRDEKMTIDGNLSVGDNVAITYTGNLNEEPVAHAVKVTLENHESPTYTASGILSEITKESLLLSIDSAAAYRIALTNNTTFSGLSKEAKAGDTVEVSYKGVLYGNNAEAVSVKIVKQAEKADSDYHVMNGLIDTITDKVIILQTKNDYYVFDLSPKVRLKGSKLAVGKEATITYKGDLKNGPIAVSIYCSNLIPEYPEKDTAREKEKTAGSPEKTGKTEKERGEKTDEEKSPEEIQDSETEPAQKESEEEKETRESLIPETETKKESEETLAPEPENEPEEETIQESEEDLLPDTETKEESEETLVPEPVNEPVEEPVQESEEDLLPDTEIKEESEETLVPEPVNEPEEESIQESEENLLPDTETKEESEEAFAPDSVNEPEEESIQEPEEEPGEILPPEPENEPEEEPVQEPEEVIDEPEEEPEEMLPPEPENEPEEEPVQEPEEEEIKEPEKEPEEEEDTFVLIRAYGEIKSISEFGCKIKTDKGKTLKLSFFDGTDVASGYFPEKGHFVDVEYDPDEMKVYSISLVEK